MRAPAGGGRWETGLQIKPLIPPAPGISRAGQWLPAVPGSTSPPPCWFCMAGKGLRECGSDKQGCLKPGFPGHVLSLHLRPSPRQNLGTKRIFCPLQGSASHKNKLAETHVPGRGWEVGGTAQTASERNFHSVLRCLRQGFGSEEQILHQSLEEMHKTGRSGEQ